MAEQVAAGDGHDDRQPLLECRHGPAASPGLGHLHTGAEWDEVKGRPSEEWGLLLTLCTLWI